MRLALCLLLALAACGKKAEPPKEEAAAPAPAPAQPPQPEVKKTWVETDPIKCKGNAWDKHTGIGGVVGFFETKGINVYNTATVSYNQLYGQPMATCNACNCPTGEALYLWVAVTDVQRLAPYGFRQSAVDPLFPESYVRSRASKEAQLETPQATSTISKPAAKKKPVTRKKKRRRS